MIYEFNLVNNMLRKVHTDSSLNARAAQPTQPTSADNRTVRRTDGQADKRTALVPSELTNLLAQFSAQGMWQVCPTSTSFEATSAARTTTSPTITATTETTTTTSCLLYDF